MPEGDTVWLAAQRLHDALAGHRLTGSDFRVPQLATVNLAGRTVEEVVPRGKHLLTRFEGGLTLHTHFRMDGSWHLYRPGAARRGGPDWQVRVVLTTGSWQAVGYRLPVVALLPTVEEDSVVGHLGPDLLGPDWGPGALAEAVRRVGAVPERLVGEALLDQRNLAGIGNLYKSESLFLAGITPWTRVADVPDLVGLVMTAQRLLARNRGHPVQITTNDQLTRARDRWHWVFERSGRPCHRCGTTVLLGEHGEAPRQRLAYWCPRCQAGPSPRPLRRAQVARTLGRSRYRP